jgi:hypothetical protein
MKKKLSNSTGGRRLSQLYYINYRRGPFYFRGRMMEPINILSVLEYKKNEEKIISTILTVECPMRHILFQKELPRS